MVLTPSPSPSEQLYLQTDRQKAFCWYNVIPQWIYLSVSHSASAHSSPHDSCSHHWRQAGNGTEEKGVYPQTCLLVLVQRQQQVGLFITSTAECDPNQLHGVVLYHTRYHCWKGETEVEKGAKWLWTAVYRLHMKQLIHCFTNCLVMLKLLIAHSDRHDTRTRLIMAE